MDPVAKLLGLDGTSRPGERLTPAPTPRPGRVSKVDTPTASVWVTPDDGDPRTPLGPCLAATEAVLDTSGSTPVLRQRPLPLGRRFLTLATTAGTWVIASHREGT